MPKLQAQQMDDWLKQARAEGNGRLMFGAAPAMNWANQVGGVNYASATAGSQTYQASSLVSR